MGRHVWGTYAERPWWGVNTARADAPIETFLLPPRSVSVNPGVDGGAVAWKSPITGRVKVRGRLPEVHGNVVQGSSREEPGGVPNYPKGDRA